LRRRASLVTSRPEWIGKSLVGLPLELFEAGGE
jgi:hypothetical protein